MSAGNPGAESGYLDWLRQVIDGIDPQDRARVLGDVRYVWQRQRPDEPLFWHDGEKVIRYFGDEEPREATPEELAQLKEA